MLKTRKEREREIREKVIKRDDNIKKEYGERNRDNRKEKKREGQKRVE